MVSKPLTIDNLGIDASIRYAKDQAAFEAQFSKEAEFVSQKSEISVAKPYIPSEFDPLFSLGKTVVWAFFSPPTQDLGSGRALFSYQLIPSLGSYEKQEDAEEKLATLQDALDQARQSRGDGASDEELEEEEEEKKTIGSLLLCINRLDRSLSLINSQRNRFQRG
jgi:hypothetical protein